MYKTLRKLNKMRNGSSFFDILTVTFKFYKINHYAILGHINLCHKYFITIYSIIYIKYIS